MEIRLLKKSEINSAARIVGKNYTKEYARMAKAEISAMFQKGANQPVYFVVEDQGKILGFAGHIQSWMDYNAYEVFWVNVLPEHQKQGIGKQLVSKVISEIKKKNNAKIILLTANEEVGNPTYYKNKFGFKTLEKFGKSYHLMSLSVRKRK